MSLNDTNPKTISAQSRLLAEDSITSCLTTHCHSKDIQCHVLPLFSMLANHQIRHRATTNWLANRAIADGNFNLPLGFVWISMG